jgi:hypothetical protein
MITRSSTRQSPGGRSRAHIALLFSGALALGSTQALAQSDFDWTRNGSILRPTNLFDRIGIGTSNPQDVVHLFRPSPSTVGVLMGNSFTGNARRGFLIDYHFTNGAELWNFQNTDMWFGTNNTRRMTIRADGRISIPGEVSIRGDLKLGTLRFTEGSHVCAAVSDGVSIIGQNPVQIGVCSSAAENVPTVDTGRGFPQAGDLVSIVRNVPNPYGDDHGPFVVAKSQTACDADVMGFITPWKRGDGRKLNEHYVPMAIYGFFPAKVTTENGPIKRGDPITSSSKAGYGMKATDACKVVGYALEDADAEGTVQVFAHLTESAGPAVAGLRSEVQRLRDANSALATRMEALSERLVALEGTGSGSGARVAQNER